MQKHTIMALCCLMLAAHFPAVGQEKGDGRPLTFVLSVGLNEPLNGQNGVCFSKPITIAPPPNWPAGSSMPARALIEPYQAKFLAACKARYNVRQSVGEYIWNREELDKPQRHYQVLVEQKQGLVPFP